MKSVIAEEEESAGSFRLFPFWLLVSFQHARVRALVGLIE
jgi:hypothetical protein